MACEETIIFADDYGYNETTFCCQLKKGHKGPHKEIGSLYCKKYELTWSDPE